LNYIIFLDNIALCIISWITLKEIYFLLEVPEVWEGKLLHTILMTSFTCLLQARTGSQDANFSPPQTLEWHLWTATAKDAHSNTTDVTFMMIFFVLTATIARKGVSHQERSSFYNVPSLALPTDKTINTMRATCSS
jgi:hypothetical protein